MDGAVRERPCERLVHAAVLIDEGEAVEGGADDRDLEVIASARPVLDSDLDSVGKGLLEEGAYRFGVHRRRC